MIQTPTLIQIDQLRIRSDARMHPGLVGCFIFLPFCSWGQTNSNDVSWSMIRNVTTELITETKEIVSVTDELQLAGLFRVGPSRNSHQAS